MSVNYLNLTIFTITDLDSIYFKSILIKYLCWKPELMFGVEWLSEW